MPHYTPLITTLVAGFGLAFIFGYLAHKLKLSPIVGYLTAGIVIGPATPGYTADMSLAAELAEIGIILLMFGVGLHFSWRELNTVKHIAIPGAVVQIIIATILGLIFSYFLDWSLLSGLVFGFALAVASTVVLLRALEEWHLLKTNSGRIAIGWLLIEDLVVIFILVFLPFIALFKDGIPQEGVTYVSKDFLWLLFITAFKAFAFIIFMVIVGKRVLPRLLYEVAKEKSPELFRLAVLSIALAVAFFAAHLFGVSFALGAFFAGMFLSESTLSHRAAEDTLPLRDAFAVLFFVSVGMLIRPEIFLSHPILLLITLLIIMIGKSLAAYCIVRLFKYPVHTALIISAGLAQIGEFSFILVELGFKLGLLSQKAVNLVLACAFISIMLNPLLFRMINHYYPKRKMH